MRLTLWIAVLALAGCSATYHEPELSADHPASPDASVVSRGERRATLDLSATDPVAPAPPASAGGHEGHGASPAPREPAGNALYVCPMHPEVTSDKPGQRCPKCAMALVRRGQGGNP
jgi:hypothetical protein